MTLVIARHQEQALRIGNVRIVVTGIRNGRVYLGVDAPDDVLIVREELLTEGPPTANGHKSRLPREH